MNFEVPDDGSDDAVDGQEKAGMNAELCDRCGNFAKSPRIIVNRRVCSSCLEIPGVDFIEKFRNEMWGRRDGFFVLVGLGLLYQGVAVLGLGLQFVQTRSLAMLLFMALVLVGMANSIAYLCKVKFARLMLVLLNIIGPVFSAGIVLAFDGTIAPELAGQLVGQGVIGFVVSFVIFRSVRNRLAFEIEVPQADLEAYYGKNRDNPVARYGSSLGLLGLLVPIFAPIGLIVSIMGLRAIDPQAWPPVGNRQAAIVGLVASSLGLIWGTAVLVLVILGR